MEQDLGTEWDGGGWNEVERRERREGGRRSATLLLRLVFHPSCRSGQEGVGISSHGKAIKRETRLLLTDSSRLRASPTAFDSSSRLLLPVRLQTLVLLLRFVDSRVVMPSSRLMNRDVRLDLFLPSSE